MVVLSLTGRDELGVECARSLVVELMGRASNVILCDEDMRIIDCMRRVDFGEEAYRRLLPGMLYKYPQRPAKPCFFALEAQERRRLLEAMPREKEPSAALLDTFSALLAADCQGAGPTGQGDTSTSARHLRPFAKAWRPCELTPTLLKLDGKLKGLLLH